MPELADPNDPYVDNRGLVITPEPVDDFTPLTGKGYNLDTIPRLVSFVQRREISLDNLPEQDIKEQTAIAAMIGLFMMGVSVVEISQMLGISVETVNRYLNKEAAQQTFELMFMSIIHTNSHSLQGRISAYSHKAVARVATLMDDETAPHIVQLKAAQDILDRSGTNAEQFFKDSDPTNRADGLEIVFTDAKDQETKVSVKMK